MPVVTLHDRLEHVKPSDAGHWLARCPVHGDRSPSLSIRELVDGRVLVHADRIVIAPADLALRRSERHPTRDWSALMGAHSLPKEGCR